MTNREPDAWVGKTAGGFTPLVLRPGTHVQRWRENGATLEPAFVRTPEDREVLLRAAFVVERALSNSPEYSTELAAKLRELAGDPS